MVDHIIFFIFAIGNVLISCAMEIKKAEIRDWDNIVRMYKMLSTKWMALALISGMRFIPIAFY